MASSRTYRILAGVTLVAALGAGVMLVNGAVGDAPPVTYVWTAPATGSPVAFYRVQLSLNDGPFSVIGTTPTTSYVLTVAWGNKYVIRVAGVDAEGRQGPYSVPSVPYTPEIPPPAVP